MNGKSMLPPSEAKASGDRLKWLLVWLLLVVGIGANYYFAQVPVAVRAAVGILWVLMLIGIVWYTVLGQRVWGFFKGARTELRKVVWPTRQETTQTTLVVVAMVVVTALILWGVDSLFMGAIGWFTS